MNRSELVADGAYLDSESDLYFYSPDGRGVYWYNTYEEMVTEHGAPSTIHHIEYLTDF